MATWLHELGIWDEAEAAAGAASAWSTCMGLRPAGPVPAWAEEPDDDPQPAQAPACTVTDSGPHAGPPVQSDDGL
jgi:hypothetical protein